MKTTYVFDLNNVNLELILKPTKKYIDYYFNRKKMIRWDVERNIFTEYNGLSDISLTKSTLIPKEYAKKNINIKNVEFLVNRKLLGEYCFEEINRYGDFWLVIAEDAKQKYKLFEEKHLVFDERIDRTPPFKFKNVFYGNIYDYLEQKKIER